MRTNQSRGLAVALVAGVFGVMAAGAHAQGSPTPAQQIPPAQQSPPAQQNAAPAAASATPAAPIDLTGDWKLDPAHSDMPPQGGGGGGGGGGGPEGANAEAGGGGGSRGPRLPAMFHITQTPSLVSFEDTTGTVLQEIATVAAAADTMTRAAGALHVLGSWDGKMLTITHQSQRGKMKETWQLEKSGQALDQVIAFDTEEGSRTMKRVYRRIATDQP